MNVDFFFVLSKLVTETRFENKIFGNWEISIQSEIAVPVCASFLVRWPFIHELGHGPNVNAQKSARLPHIYRHTSQIKYVFRLEENLSRVMFQNSTLQIRLGQTKLNNSLGKKQLEFSTGTWSGRASWNGGKFVCQSRAWHKKNHWIRATFLARKGIHYWKKGLKIAKQDQINEDENLMIWCLQAFNFGAKNRSPVLGKSLFDRCRLVGKWVCHLQV